MSTIQVGEIKSSVDEFTAGLSQPLELPEVFVDYIELVLCFLLGATILRCFYGRICWGGARSQKEKKTA